tara:strand:+ start:885 stop:1592 length:708 start_codon:yes stop_codon:yes gene_type:complete
MINFDTILKNTLLNKKVFVPNLTSQLSYEVASKKIKRNTKVLDLGCGSGIIGIGILKNSKNVKMFCSDPSQSAYELTQKNFKKNKLKATIKKGDLFFPWKNYKFDYIVNDVSGISQLIANKSPWFNNFIPCETGSDGTKLTIKIIKLSKKFLTKKGILQIPILSLSNEKKILKYAKEIFSKVKVESSREWFLPKEMEKLKKFLSKLKSKGHINFSLKFGKIVCKTSILTCTILRK